MGAVFNFRGEYFQSEVLNMKTHNSSPALALPPGEASASQATALPPGKANASPATALSPGEGITPSQANTPLRPLLTPTPLGLPRQVKLVTQLGLPGIAIGAPPTLGQLRLPRRSTLPPMKATPPSPPVGFPKVLPRKNLTVSGS